MIIAYNCCSRARTCVVDLPDELQSVFPTRRAELRIATLECYKMLQDSIPGSDMIRCLRTVLGSLWAVELTKSVKSVW